MLGVHSELCRYYTANKRVLCEVRPEAQKYTANNMKRVLCEVRPDAKKKQLSIELQSGTNFT